MMDGEIKILDYKKLNVQKQLGRGTFGTVYLANCDEVEVTNPVVMKVMNESVSTGDAARKLFMKEARLLAELHHENIVRMHGICMNPLAIVLEHMVFDFAPFNINVKVNTLDKGLSEIAPLTKSGGCVFDHLIPAIANDVTKGLSHLHYLEVAHRDLKPANILISNQHYCALLDKQQIERIKAVRPVVCKLADFGESRSQLLQTNGLNDPNTKHVFRGTIPFMAPEILLPEGMMQGRKLSLEDLKKVDIWALGLVFYCLINPGVSYPYQLEATDLTDIIMMLRQRKRPTSNPGYLIKQETVWSRVKEAFESCTSHDSSKRPKASDVLAVLNPSRVPGRNVAYTTSIGDEMPLRHRLAAKRQAGSNVQPLQPIRPGNPARVAANQWYTGAQGERALKYIFAKFTSIADTEVEMSRRTDIQDVTLSFEAHGQLWHVTFPNNFPGSNASLTTSGENCTIIGGDTVEAAIDAILNRISSAQPRGQMSDNPAHVAADQWYAGEQGEAALKFVLDKFTNIADSADVQITRATDTQDVTLTFERHGQEWQVAFPNNFPRSRASLTCFGQLNRRIGGDTIAIAVSSMISCISSLDQPSPRGNGAPQVAAHDQWYFGEEGEAALKYIFDELRSIAESEVRMTRKLDTQDLALNFQHEGQDWQVEFPSDFPRSHVTLSTNEEERLIVSGNTVKTAVSAIIARIRDSRPTPMAVTQWYASKEGEMALRYIFDELRNFAEGNTVNMSRKTDTQDLTMSFQRHGQDWHVKFPFNFPRSSARLSYNGTFYARVGGDTVENAVSAIINRIS